MSIIDSSLIKDLLREWYTRGFKFEEHQRLHLLVIHNGITTFF